MKHLSYCWLVGTLLCCASPNKPATQTPSEYAAWEQIFQEVENILAQDAGQFWQHPLQGPLMFVDPESRQFIANEQDSAESFTPIGQVFVDTLPPELIIANTAFDWRGKSWTMLMRPLPQDITSRNALIIHELFHHIQDEIGFTELKESDNAHLDAFEGRVLLRLELQALLQACRSTHPDSLQKHLRNALSFRAQRQSKPHVKQAENALELNEGLAEYTGLMLSARPHSEIPSYFQKRVEAFYQKPSFVRSFAYETIPIYGYFLAQKEKYWHHKVKQKTNLSDFLQEALAIKELRTKNYEVLAVSEAYSFGKIWQEEQSREKDRLAQIARYKTLFLEKPSLSLHFIQMNLSMDPGNLVPLEGMGTVYPSLSIHDTWGILQVKKGGLISADWSKVILSEPQEISKNLVKGDGWTLELANNWQVEKEGDNYLVRKSE